MALSMEFQTTRRSNGRLYNVTGATSHRCKLEVTMVFQMVSMMMNRSSYIRKNVAFLDDVPPPLREQWAEACKCFDAKAYTAAVVMVRRLLEATCADQGAAKRTLAASLKDLRERGLINGVLVEWADALRALGNEGAHYTGTSVNREDAEDALAFAEAVVDYLYVLHLRFEQYKWRRELEGNGH